MTASTRRRYCSSLGDGISDLSRRTKPSCATKSSSAAETMQRAERPKVTSLLRWRACRCLGMRRLGLLGLLGTLAVPSGLCGALLLFPGVQLSFLATLLGHDRTELFATRFVGRHQSAVVLPTGRCPRQASGWHRAIGTGALPVASGKHRAALTATRQQERDGDSQQMEENEAAAHRGDEHGKSNAERRKRLPMAWAGCRRAIPRP